MPKDKSYAAVCEKTLARANSLYLCVANYAVAKI